VFGEGQFGRAEGLIFSGFEIGCEFDKESFKNYRHGVDWGFSIDPFCYVRVAVDFNKMELYICDEVYGRNLQNTETAPMVKAHANYETVFCDCAEPKSIAEYQTLGVNAEGVKKGQGSVESGIKYMQRFKIFIHRDCPHIADEFMNYSWKVNRATGEPLNMPEDSFNHGIDAIRYSLNADVGGEGNPSLTFF
jgi:phage terminase large subunit